MKGGDKKNFISIANSVGELVQEKNEAYGDSFAKSQEIVKILFPDGVQPGQYRDMLAITRVIDKLFRIATKKDAFGESPWRDICGYAILGIANDECEVEVKTNAELWEEQQEETMTVRHTYRDLLRNPDDYMSEEEQERLRESILQSVRDKREKGHGNPYANIDDRDDDGYYTVHATDRSKTNAEGNKDKDYKDNNKDNELVSFDEWNSYVSSESKSSKDISEKSHE